MSPPNHVSLQNRVAAILFILTIAIRWIVLNRFFESPFFTPDSGDTAFYNSWAQRILNGDITDGQAFYGLPGYAWLLAGIYGLFGYTPYVPAMFQTIAEGFTAVIIFRISCLLWPEDRRGPLIGAVAGLVWMLFTPAQAFSIVLMPTSYVVLAFWGLVYWLLHIRYESGKQKVGSRNVGILNPWIWIGILTGFTAMFVATIFAILPLAIVTIFRTLHWRNALGAFVLLFGGVLVGCSPCWIHNYFIAREPVLLSAHSGINFYVGNNLEATGYPKIPTGMRADQAGMLKDSVLLAERETGGRLRRVDVSKFWSDKAKAYISENPGDWLMLIGKKLRNLANAYQYDDLSLIALFKSQGILFEGLSFGLVLAFAIPGALVLAQSQKRALWIVAATIVYATVLLPVFITERYRLPLVPGLAILAIGGGFFLGRALTERRMLSVGIYLAALISALFVVWWPVATPKMLALDQFNVGNRLLRAGKLETASVYLKCAYENAPDNAEINFAMGNLAFENGDLNTAKQFYRRTLELDPKHKSAYNNLGVMAIQENRPEIAREFFARSINCEPDDAKSWYLLARVQLQLGENADARSSINRAIELNPQQVQFKQLREKISANEPRIDATRTSVLDTQP